MPEQTVKLDANIGAYQIIRAYAWAILKKNMPGVWSEDKYGGLTPIVPVSEEKELDEYSGPHIVMGYSESPTGNPYESECSVTFANYDDNFWRLGETTNTLIAVFGQQDESADRVNRYSSNFDYFIGLRFGSIDIGFVDGGTPETEEGGRQSALLNIKFNYFVNYEVDTNVP